MKKLISIYTIAQTIILSFALIAGTLTQTACPKGSHPLTDYVMQLRLGLAVSGAFLDSLNLGPERQAVANDFIQFGDNAATLGDDIKACGSDKPCKVRAVAKFQTAFWDVLRHGHFKLSPKLERIQTIVQAIINAATVYYGGTLPRTARRDVDTPDNPKAAEIEIKLRLQELKAATQP
jgi:hypothetical protein